MQINKEVIDFLNKIIIKAETKEQLINNVNIYKKYLELTEDYDNEFLKFLDYVIKTSDKIFEIKETFGVFDIKGIIKDIDIKDKEITKRKVVEKHYNHFVHDNSDNYSYSCGTSSSTYRSC